MESLSVGAKIDEAIQDATTLFTVPPRGHLFQSRSGKTYWLDTNTSHIILCDEISEQILRGLGHTDLDKHLDPLIQKYGPDAVCRALDSILRLASENEPRMLSTKAPTKLLFPVERETYAQLLKSKIGKLNISLTGNCSGGCLYCSYSSTHFLPKKRTYQVMSEDVLLRSLDYYLSHSTEREARSIGFFGGEPTLCMPLIKQAVMYVEDRLGEQNNTTFNISTNLMSVDKASLQYIVEKGIYLTVSLDGPAEVHDRYRRTVDGRPSFEAVMSNLEYVRSLDEDFFQTHVMFMATWAPPYDMESVRRFFGFDERLPESRLMASNPAILPDTDFWKGIDLREGTEGYLALQQEFLDYVAEGVYTPPVDRPSGATATSTLTEFLKQIFYKRYLHLYRRPVVKIPLPDPFYFGGLCVPGVFKLFVNYDGAFFPCERTTEHESIQIGDCYSGVNVERVYEIVEGYLNASPDECYNCWGLLLCNTVCYAHYYKSKGPCVESKRKKCQEFRDYMSRLLSDMAHVLEQNPKGFEFLNRYEISD